MMASLADINLLKNPKRLISPEYKLKVAAMINITDKEFKELSRYIKENYGINLKPEKQSLVNTRLNCVLAQKNFESFTDYYQYLTTDKTGEALSTLIDKITTNHTFFMRESDHFIYFRDKVLPYLGQTIKDGNLRIWCAGCSSGEESYTLAMLIDEYVKLNNKQWDRRILATDISSKVLDTAVKGIYDNESISTLPGSMRLNYFKKVDSQKSSVVESIKNQVIYRRFNLMEDVFPFKKKFHVIFCRNVMIYFDNITKINLVNKFYDLTESGGYLFIGHSESLMRDETKYKYNMPAVYRKE